ncbi:hypothetical protein [Flagellimonas sp.]|uniref:hypothetical protein n=1 Tax=Flagellimonas sp. TaxID=2058762 RepID=UPI003B5C07D1
MIKKLLIATFFISTLSVNAQESVVFKYEFAPNKKYITQMTTKMSGLMNMNGDEATMNQMANSGMEFPIKMEQKTNATLTNITGKMDSQGNIPMSISYDKMEMEMSMNGKDVSTPNVFEDVTLYGKYLAGSKMQIDSISGNDIDQNMKSVLESALEQVQKQIHFPEHPIAIGDEFENEIPMSFPMGNMAPMEMIIKTTYNLQQIENEIAFFNIDQSIELESQQPSMTIKAEGAGSGKMLYNITNNYMSKYETKLPMKMLMQMGDVMSMEMDMNTDTVLTISME